MHVFVDPTSPKHPRHTVIFLPGALSSSAIFADARGAFGSDVKLMHYAFPGLHGRPIDPPIDIREEGKRLATFIAQNPPGHVSLVGYSTGAAIAIEAAYHTSKDNLIRLALVSPSPECAGGWRSTVAGVRDIAFAAKRADTFKLEKLWLEYWKLLLVGREDYASGARACYAETMLQRHLAGILLPTKALRKAHTQSIRKWRVPMGFCTHKHQIAVYFGNADPVFTAHQTRDLLVKLGTAREKAYPNQGHLVPLSEPDLFKDISAFLFD